MEYIHLYMPINLIFKYISFLKAEAKSCLSEINDVLVELAEICKSVFYYYVNLKV